MGESRQHAGFSKELERGLIAQMPKKFQGDKTIDMRVERLINGPHGTVSDRGHDSVATDCRTQQVVFHGGRFTPLWCQPKSRGSAAIITLCLERRRAQRDANRMMRSAVSSRSSPMRSQIVTCVRSVIIAISTFA